MTAVTEPGDVVWEPFGGLCSASVAALTLGRRAFAAKTDRNSPTSPPNGYGVPSPDSPGSAARSAASANSGASGRFAQR